MAAVKLGEKARQELLAEHWLHQPCRGCRQCAELGHRLGDRQEITALREMLRKRKVPAQVLDINYPFHHPLIDKAKSAFFADAPQIAPRDGDIAFISLSPAACSKVIRWMPTTGGAMSASRYSSMPPRSGDCACAASSWKISPRAILGSYVARQRAAGVRAISVVPTLNKEEVPEGVDPVAQSLARAIAHGAEIREAAVFGARRAEIALPGLPLEKSTIKPDPHQ